MSLHRSLKTKPAALNQHRNVLTRTERIVRLTEEGRFHAGDDSPMGLVKVRLYRPVSVERFVGCLPSTVKSIAVMDRTKEAGAIGEPGSHRRVAAREVRLDLRILDAAGARLVAPLPLDRLGVVEPGLVN